ncbi:MAG: UDP-N-acetylmuramoyl-tripeptide--D-alanyl-D-alanine ligase [Chloroflexi bacterium]|nr:UDP-N-acetylmuramoyl-tripeptide--D-alanyl-D-alanine ligase [Chloroflexota bacterium]
MLTLADVLEALTGHRSELVKLTINEAVIDSRQAFPGSIFVALPGERTDGHNFVDNAFKNGASLALVQKDLSGQFPVLDLRGKPDLSEITVPTSILRGTPFCLRVENTLEALQRIAGFYRRKLDVRVIGITGSVGKSTTKELIAEVLSQRYRTLKNTGNLNNEIGLPLTLLRLGMGHQRAVLEMGFFVPGEISLLCDLALPEVGVITNVGTVHAERAGSQEIIARGKAELVQALPPAPKGVAILNYDDPLVRPMKDLTQASVFYYGLNPAADLWADQVEGMGLEGIRFRLHYRNETLHLRIPLIGQHSVHTALRAAAVGLVEGLTWGEIIEGLRKANTQLRLVAVRTQRGALILDDSYNASPESTLAALNLLNELDGRRVAVLGEMLELGQYERQGHEIVGMRAAEVSHRLIAVGERAKLIVDAAIKAGMSSTNITWVPDVPDAIQVLHTELKEGDVVLVKGSHGLRMDRIVSALESVS